MKKSIQAHSKTQYKRLVAQGANVVPPGDGYIIYETGRVRVSGIYLDGTYTREMALAIKKEVDGILEYFARTDAALKKSMEKSDE